MDEPVSELASLEVAIVIGLPHYIERAPSSRKEERIFDCIENLGPRSASLGIGACFVEIASDALQAESLSME